MTTFLWILAGGFILGIVFAIIFSFSEKTKTLSIISICISFLSVVFFLIDITVEPVKNVENATNTQTNEITYIEGVDYSEIYKAYKQNELRADDKYKNNLNNPFIMGYYIHLFTDKLWFDKFLNNLVQSNSVKLMDGIILKTTPEELEELIYSDYTNLNINVIEEYNMDLTLFYEEFQKPNTTIDEIPTNKLNILIDKMGIIIENSKQEKNYIFDIYLIKQFIEDTKERILKEIKDYECVTS